MSQSTGYVYSVRLAPTALTAAKTIIQIKAGAAALEILSVKVFQITKIASELLHLQILRKSAAATVTSFTPLKVGGGDPTSLAVGSTSGTGITATAEGTDTDILEDDIWNVLNGSWTYLPTPEERIWVAQGTIIGIKVNTAPAASMSIGCRVLYMEYQ